MDNVISRWITEKVARQQRVIKRHERHIVDLERQLAAMREQRDEARRQLAEIPEMSAEEFLGPEQ